MFLSSQRTGGIDGTGTGYDMKKLNWQAVRRSAAAIVIMVVFFLLPLKSSGGYLQLF